MLYFQCADQFVKSIMHDRNAADSFVRDDSHPFNYIATNPDLFPGVKQSSTTGIVKQIQQRMVNMKHDHEKSLIFLPQISYLQQ